MTPLWPYLLLLIVLAFPSANFQLSNGLPFSTWPEFLALAFLLPFLLFSDLRRSAARWVGSRRILEVSFFLFSALALLLKVLLLAAGIRQGFAGCYSSPAAWAPTAGSFPAPAGCELSYEDIFGLSGATRMDRAIDFGKDSWNLVFLNTSRYDYYDWEPGVIPRDRIPLAVRWTGRIDLPEPSQWMIEYAGEGSLRIGEQTIALARAYDDVSEIQVDAPAGNSGLTVDYLFDDGVRTGQDGHAGPRAQIHVWLSDSSGTHPLRTADPGPLWRVLAVLADLFLLIPLMLLAPAILPEFRPGWAVFPIFAVFLAAVYLLPFSAWIRELAMTAGLAGVWMWHLWRGKLRPAVLYAAVVLTALAITRLWQPSLENVARLPAGNDPLGFESQAYSILLTGSLEGGEAVYYAQPMSRYLLFAGHALLGDGGALLAASGMALFFGGIFFLSHPFAGVTRSRWKNLAILVAGGGLWLVGGYYISGVIRSGLPDHVTWSFLLYALPLLFLSDSTLSVTTGFAMLAVSFTVRSNQLPAILWILGLASILHWRRNRRAVSIGIATAVVLGCLPLLHNLYFGHQFVLTTTSAGVSANLTLPPAVWLDFFRGNTTAIASVHEQVAMLFLMADVDRSQWPTLLGMAILLFSWLGAGIYALVRRKPAGWAFLVIPILYLAPHLFFVVNTYYPRHIAIGYLAMGAAVWLVFLRSEVSPPARSGPPSAVKSS